MMTFENALREAEETLQKAGVLEYKNDAFLLMTDLFDMSRTRFLIDKKNDMSDDIYSIYKDAVNRRALKEPLQYITGKAFFYGYEFKVNDAVLIPRMDTECLVEEVLKLMKSYSIKDTIRVMDMCTGSGCILLSVLLENQSASGIGVDISTEALNVAKDNANRLLLDGQRAEFIESDLYSNVSGKFDFIVSNPPYIRPEVIEELMPEVKDHEPYIALYGHDDGLFFYENITANARNYLNDGGYLCYEIGYDQGEAVSLIMKQYGFKDCIVKKDLAGLDRIVIGHL